MKHQLDKTLLGSTILLVTSGVLLIATISFPLAFEKFNDGYYFLRHQIIYGLLPGILLGFVAFKIPLNFLRKKSLILFLINLIILSFVFLPRIGATFEGASRWVRLGNITFQPSEFLKITAILYLASLVSKNSFKKNNKKRIKIFYPQLFSFLIILAIISLVLYFQPHISTLGIILASLLLIYFSGKTPIFHTIFIILFLSAGLFFLLQSAPYRLQRVSVFLEPDIDSLGIGYQLKQSLIAIGSGKILGQGLGMSRQKFGFLPQPASDSIFAIFAEETGFLGSIILISLFLIFLWRGIKISKENSDIFFQLVSLGITFWIVFQAFLNIGGLLGIIPLSGIPLSFISYGGSHLIAELIGVGLLLNISRYRTL